MRLFLLPITTSRTLLYCQRLNVATTDKQGLVDRVTKRAAKLWSGWEKKEKGWQKTVVGYGNYALRRIPYEEWGLKSVPPISARRRTQELRGEDKVELVFPPSFLPTHRVESVLAKLATEREALHRKRLIWCCVGMPITIPFALVPVIPNLPFFYLVYRAWSHWRALAGGRHLDFILKNKLLALSPSELLDNMYTKSALPPAAPDPAQAVDGRPPPVGVDAKPAEAWDGAQTRPDESNTLLLSQKAGKEIAEALELPELEVEIERAIWQVTSQQKSAVKENPERLGSASSSPQDEEEKKWQ